MWEFDLANNVISIGWTELGDVSEMDKDALAQGVAAAYPKNTPAAKSLIANMLWSTERLIRYDVSQFFDVGARLYRRWLEQASVCVDISLP